MTKKLSALILWIFLSTSALAQVKPLPEHSATTAVPKESPFWQTRQALLNERAAAGGAELIFIGDSITQGWERAGREIWAKYYGERSAINLGISGDRTQHVLWRLANGNIESIAPKAAVIMIGTNNVGANTSDEIADGVEAIVRTLRRNLPNTKILLLAIFPRDEKPGPRREKLTTTNVRLAKLDDGENIFYLDIGQKFLEADGTLTAEIMPDFLHLSPRGYEIWAEAMEPKLSELLGAK